MLYSTLHVHGVCALGALNLLLYKNCIKSYYSSLDPYSSLTLVAPKGWFPLWSLRLFLEGHKDIIVHGGVLTKALYVTQNISQVQTV